MMKYSWLVAAREYGENVKTKGFWVGIFIFPVILYAMTVVPRFLEKKATPVRYFALVDETGEFLPSIERGLANKHKWDIAEELALYFQDHWQGMAEALGVTMGVPGNGKGGQVPDLESMPAFEWDNLDWEQFGQGGMLNPMKILESRGLNKDAVGEVLGEIKQEQIFGELRAQLRKKLAADNPDWSAEELEAKEKEILPEFVPPEPKLVQVPLPAEIPTGNPEETIRALKPYLTGDKKITMKGEETKIFAFIYIPKDIEAAILYPVNLRDPNAAANLGKQKPRGVEYWCTNQAANDLKNLVKRGINQEIRRKEYLAKNLDEAVVKGIQDTRVAFSSFDPKKAEGEEQVSIADQIRQWAPVAFVYILWVGIFTIASMLLNNTVEEKSNRIVEVLLSSVTPWELMFGKLIGVACVGLTMLSAWVISAVVVLYSQAGAEGQWATEAFKVVTTSSLFPAFVGYFIAGYLMYGGIFLAIGSICNTIKEAQNMMGPVMMILIVPLILMMFIPKDPNGTLATVLSWVPVYTPFIMMNRAGADPPMFEVVGTAILMLVTMGAILWLSGKIFKVGILRTGQPPKIMELIRWIKGT